MVRPNHRKYTYGFAFLSFCTATGIFFPLMWLIFNLYPVEEHTFNVHFIKNSCTHTQLCGYLIIQPSSSIRTGENIKKIQKVKPAGLLVFCTEWWKKNMQRVHMLKHLVGKKDQKKITEYDSSMCYWHMIERLDKCMN